MKKSPLFFPSAFTLVELIVVIAVLAVLAAISFSTVANISSGARDSARLTDISSMKTSLETYNATKGGFPMPDNATAISWSGNLAWSQGTFGDNTARTLNTISRPKDPKWNVDYSYSVTNSKKEYEIAAVLEKATSFNGVEKAYAQGEQYDTIIKGNYNSVALRVSSTISTWILSVPTLIASDIKDAKLENVVFAYPKTGNEPFSYTGVVNSPQAVPANWTVKQVWSGALVLPKTDSELQQLTNDLKTAYTGSPASNSEVIKSLLTTSDGKAYGANVVNNVGGSISVYGKTCKICGATTGIATQIATGLSGPYGIVMDNIGNLYITSYHGNRITKVDTSGVATTFVSWLLSPWGIAIDNIGNLYVANYGGDNILKVTSTGVVTTFASGGGLSHPTGIVLDNTGNFYVANSGNNTISKVSSTGIVTLFASGVLNPYGITIDASEYLYVTNATANTISKITPAGVVSTFVSGIINAPYGIIMDSAGNFYVATGNGGTISKISPTGTVTQFITGLSAPVEIFLDNAGILYVGLTGDGTLSKITPQ